MTIRSRVAKEGSSFVEQASPSKTNQNALEKCERYLLRYKECFDRRTFPLSKKCDKQEKDLKDCLSQWLIADCKRLCKLQTSADEGIDVLLQANEDASAADS